MPCSCGFVCNSCVGKLRHVGRYHLGVRAKGNRSSHVVVTAHRATVLIDRYEGGENRSGIQRHQLVGIGIPLELAKRMVAVVVTAVVAVHLVRGSRGCDGSPIVGSNRRNTVAQIISVIGDGLQVLCVLVETHDAILEVLDLHLEHVALLFPSLLLLFHHVLLLQPSMLLWLW